MRGGSDEIICLHGAWRELGIPVMFAGPFAMSGAWRDGCADTVAGGNNPIDFLIGEWRFVCRGWNGLRAAQDLTRCLPLAIYVSHNEI